MNVKTAKKTERRFDSTLLSNLRIQSYGHNNLYPQEITKLVACSESASSCMDRYVSFIQGNGFRDIGFAATIINRNGDTPDDLLIQLSTDAGAYRGIALHVNYNAFCDPVEINVIPFDHCRIGEADSDGYISKIAVHPDWTGQTKRGGKILRVSEENIDYIDVYNPDKKVIAAQIEKAGSVENYKGQILWVSEAGWGSYPKPVYDSVVSQMSTEEGLGNISTRNARNNFQPGLALITRKAQDVVTDDESGEGRHVEDTTIADSLSALQGDINTGKIIHLEIEYDEEKPEILNLQGNNYDKDYEVTTRTASQKIYAAFNQEIWYRILNGSIGFSSEILRDAYEYYSTVTSKERRMIERAFEKIFKHWPQVVNPSKDFSVQPLKFISSDGTSNNPG